MTVCEVRGLRFNTRTLGNGPTVVMLHGLITGSLATWYFTIAPRLSETHTTFLLDLRGHGRSEVAPSGYGAESMALDVAELTAGLDPFSIVAHSYGCVVAARFAAANPSRVRALALVEPPFGFDIADLDVDAVTTPGPDLTARQAARLRNLVTATTILADVAAEPGLTSEEIEALPRDLLVVFGASSPCRVGEQLVATARPDARIEIIEGDHDLHLTASRELGTLVGSFLTDPQRIGATS